MESWGGGSERGGRGASSKKSLVTFGGGRGGCVCISKEFVWVSGGYYLLTERGDEGETRGLSQSVSQAWRQAWGWIYSLRSWNRHPALGDRMGTIGSLRMEGKVRREEEGRSTYE